MDTVLQTTLEMPFNETVINIGSDNGLAPDVDVF